jgi:sulfur-carrier protein adenylyltransferase/sulfurtransferase
MTMPLSDLTIQDYERYRRHLVLPEVGLSGQKKLKQAKVLCVGAGGLGSPVLLYLAAAGIGTLGIVDDDVVELSNLQRQIIYTEADLGLKKVIAAKQHLKALNSMITVNTHAVRLSADNVISLLEQYDIVVDGSDNFATRYLVNDACFHLKKPNVFASIAQFQGQCSVFTAEHGPCYRCLHAQLPADQGLPNCAEGGVLGVLPGLLGVIQATQVIQLVLDQGAPLIGRLLRVDALTMQWQEYRLDRDPQCVLCGQSQSFEALSRPQQACEHSQLSDAVSAQTLRALQENQADFLLLDVREPYEHEERHLGGDLIPLGQLSARLNELDKNKLIIVYCKLGPRSQHAVKFLKEAGFRAQYLAGGILGFE